MQKAKNRLPFRVEIISVLATQSAKCCLFRAHKKAGASCYFQRTAARRTIQMYPTKRFLARTIPLIWRRMACSGTVSVAKSRGKR